MDNSRISDAQDECAVAQVGAVRATHGSELKAAERLLPQMGGGYLVADCNHDANRLYDAAATAGYPRLTPRIA